MIKNMLAKFKIEWIAWGLLAAFVLFSVGYVTGQRSQSGVYTIKTEKTAPSDPAQPLASDTPPPPTAAFRPTPKPFDPNAPIDINSASAAELEDLPGIGPALAGRIADSRERDGPFTSVDDLERIAGIGSATIEKLRPYATCNPS